MKQTGRQGRKTPLSALRSISRSEPEVDHGSCHDANHVHRSWFTMVVSSVSGQTSCSSAARLRKNAYPSSTMAKNEGKMWSCRCTLFTSVRLMPSADVNQAGVDHKNSAQWIREDKLVAGLSYLIASFISRMIKILTHWRCRSAQLKDFFALGKRVQ